MELRKDLQDMTVDKMAPEVWYSMAKIEKMKWRKYWLNQGVEYPRCTVCKFPTDRGVYGCESCKYRKENRLPLKPAL